jgi:hypothetical protein
MFIKSKTNHNICEFLGVALLCNKIDGVYFDVFDEEVAMAFSIYCGISIMHSIVYKKIQDAQARSKLSNELMMYHMQVIFNLYLNKQQIIIKLKIKLKLNFLNLVHFGKNIKKFFINNISLIRNTLGAPL